MTITDCKHVTSLTLLYKKGMCISLGNGTFECYKKHVWCGDFTADSHLTYLKRYKDINSCMNIQNVFIKKYVNSFLDSIFLGKWSIIFVFFFLLQCAHGYINILTIFIKTILWKGICKHAVENYRETLLIIRLHAYNITTLHKKDIKQLI